MPDILTIPDAARPFIGASGLTCRQVALLHVAAANPGISVGPAADAMHVPKPAITRAADALIAAGLLFKTRSLEDQRKVYMLITEAGRRLIEGGS